MHSGNSFNEGSVELSNQSQNAPSVDQVCELAAVVRFLMQVLE